jgi:hypothetical protein
MLAGISPKIRGPIHNIVNEFLHLSDQEGGGGSGRCVRLSLNQTSNMRVFYNFSGRPGVYPAGPRTFYMRRVHGFP